MKGRRKRIRRRKARKSRNEEEEEGGGSSVGQRLHQLQLCHLSIILLPLPLCELFLLLAQHESLSLFLFNY